MPVQCVCSSSCRTAAAVDTTATVPPFLAGLSPASVPAAAAAAAVLLLLVLLSRSSAHVNRAAVFCCAHVYAVRVFFQQNLMFPILSPIRFMTCHGCVDMARSLCGSVLYLAFFRLFCVVFYRDLSICYEIMFFV